LKRSSSRFLTPPLLPIELVPFFKIIRNCSKLSNFHLISSAFESSSNPIPSGYSIAENFAGSRLQFIKISFFNTLFNSLKDFPNLPV
jgi:hypothetical protein